MERTDKQALGQFFTPPTVVSFVYDVVKIMLDREEKWQQGKYPSIIDPACGEGIFLKVALEKKFTKPKYIFGIDIDENAQKKWEDITLLKAFGSKAKMALHFYHQNGLLPLPKKRLRYKTGGLEEYDLTVGNPPYGGIGIKDLENNHFLRDEIVKFELWRKESRQPVFFPDRKDIERIEKFPIEVLFLERFVQLTKPGGYIAIIIPDGVLANAELQYVRNWLFERSKVNAIVSLPRETFKSVGTTAKTSILFLQKSDKEEEPLAKQKIFMASAEYVGVNHSGKNDLPVILEEFQKFVQGEKIKEAHMSPHFTNIIEWTKHAPHRIDADYWNPKYTKVIREMKKGKWKITILDETKPFITYGAIVPGKKMRKVSKGILYVSQTNMKPTGLDFSNPVFVRKGSEWDRQRFRLKYEDVLIARSGVASVGRAEVFREKGEAVVACFVDIFRQSKLNPYYLVTFMKSVYGTKQIERLCSGVGTVNINFAEIKTIQIPILPDSIQKKIEAEYKRMSRWHDLAMEAKARAMRTGKSPKEAEQAPEHQKNIEKAEKMLKDLIKRTEEVIEGKRDDIS